MQKRCMIRLQEYSNIWTLNADDDGFCIWTTRWSFIWIHKMFCCTIFNSRDNYSQLLWLLCIGYPRDLVEELIIWSVWVIPWFHFLRNAICGGSDNRASTKRASGVWMEPMAYTFNVKYMFAWWDLVQFFFGFEFSQTNTASVKFSHKIRYLRFNAWNIILQQDPTTQWTLSYKLQPELLCSSIHDYIYLLNDDIYLLSHAITLPCLKLFESMVTNFFEGEKLIIQITSLVMTTMKMNEILMDGEFIRTSKGN